MGNAQAVQNTAHIRIYKELLKIQNPATRVEMIRTLLAGQEYLASARISGVYSHLLAYIARVDAGQRPAALPGEMAMTAVQQPQQRQIQYQQSQTQIVNHAPPPPHLLPHSQQRPSAHIMKGRRNEKALNYFQKCLEVLGLTEEVALTEEALKKAYKRVALKAHPDKGGTEEEFEAITRAHAYLGEILLRIKGGRKKEGVVEAPEALQDTRKEASKDWEMVEPVRLNPKKLDMNAFNQMFEQTRIPDPEEDGYGDWLKGADGPSAGPKFGGKFNRDVFNQAFEEEAAKRRAQGGQVTVRQPEALTLAPMSGVELGRGGGGNYTAAVGSSMKFTDLKNAYTSENMITNQVSDVRVEARSFDQYSSSRKQAPAPLSNQEMAGVMAAEAAAAKREEQRRLRAAQEDSLGAQYFERMKRLVITNN
jgi:curved DNA-binding protein CbpA